MYDAEADASVGRNFRGDSQRHLSKMADAGKGLEHNYFQMAQPLRFIR